MKLTVHLKVERDIKWEKIVNLQFVVKGGLNSLTHALANSMGPIVRVNSICPGWIECGDYSALRVEDHAQHPVGRVGHPEDIA